MPRRECNQRSDRQQPARSSKAHQDKKAGAGSLKKKSNTSSPSSSSAVAAKATEPSREAELQQQQQLLDVFQSAFHPILSSGESFGATVQEVKQALFDRQFETAFGRVDYLDVYAARWSPTRALGYVQVLVGVREEVLDLVCGGRSRSGTAEGDAAKPEAASLQMLCIGGGAAEMVSFASLLSSLDSDDVTVGHMTLLDAGPWGGIIDKLFDSLITPSATALVSASRLQPRFLQQDILSLSQTELRGVLGSQKLLVTLLFTLNELYTSGGIAKTTSFLHNLTATIPPSSLLLVVDSAGSYSEAAVGKEGKEKKKYPMQWLLDYTLLSSDEKLREQGCSCRWEKLESNDSVWFRVSETLKYPTRLENMRYQMHLYRATLRHKAMPCVNMSSHDAV